MARYKRFNYISYVRAFCMLWIIGFWHLGGVSVFEYSNKCTLLFTKGILGAFAYLSGYLLADKEICNRKDVLNFYKKRLIRIYPLFFIAATCLYILYLFDSSFWYIMSLKQYILSVLGLACIFPPAPGTLWFIDMLLIFWGLTPLILLVKRKYKKVFLCVILYIIFFLLVRLGSDNRILLYFPYYVAGLLHNTEEYTKNRKALTILFSSTFVVACIVYGKVTNSTMIYFVELIGGSAVVGILIALGKVIERSSNNILNSVLEWISYVSMTAYLFHSPIYELLHRFIGPFSIGRAYLFVLPLVLIIAYVIQNIYEWVLKSHTLGKYIK